MARRKTLKVGSSSKNLEKRKQYIRGSAIKHRGKAVNPAETFDYVVKKSIGDNLYIFDREYNFVKAYNAHKDSVSRYFKTVIKQLTSDGTLESIISKYEENENKILDFYAKALNKPNEEDVLEEIQKTLKIKDNEIMKVILEVKDKINILFDGELVFAYSREWFDKVIDEKFSIDNPDSQKNQEAFASAILSINKMRDLILKDMAEIKNGISQNEKIVSILDTGTQNASNLYNKTYLNALNSITEKLKEQASIDVDYLFNFLHSGIYKDLGFYSEGAVILGVLEGLKENLSSTCEVVSIKTGQGKGSKIEDIPEEIADNIVQQGITTKNKKVLITTNSGKNQFTIDFSVLVSNGNELNNLKLDIKSYSGNHYKAGRTKTDSVSMQEILDDTSDLTGDDAKGRLLFVNIIANYLVSSYINKEDNELLNRMVYYWLMIKHNQLEELLGKPEESANFIVFGNKLVRFSTLLREIFNMDTTIGTKTSNQITVNYNSFSKNPETLNIKQKLKSSIEGWSSHSKESYDILYQNKEFIGTNEAVVRELKNKVLLKQKLTVNYKNLTL